jgi:hypothetical protein
VTRRRKPRFVIVLGLEQRPRLYLVCDSREDEIRLRGWLRRAGVVRQIPQLVDQLLDSLDRQDRNGEDEAA